MREGGTDGVGPLEDRLGSLRVDREVPGADVLAAAEDGVAVRSRDDV